MDGPSMLIATTICAAYAAGLLWSLPVQLLPSIARQWQWPVQRIPWLKGVVHLSVVLLMLGSGLVLDHWGAQTVLLGGLVVASLSFLGLEFRRTLVSAALVLMGIGAATACVLSATTLLMPAAFSPGRPAAATHAGFVFFTLGVLTAGVVYRWLERVAGYRRCVLLLALLFLVPAAMALWLAAPVPEAKREMDTLLRDARVLLAALLLFFYLPLERALARWTRGYLADTGFAPRGASLIVPLCWLSFLAIRVVMALVLPAGITFWWLLVLGLVTAVVLGNLSTTDRPTGGVLGLLLAAACLGPILPTLLGLVQAHFATEPGQALGLVWALALGGSCFYPALLDPSDARHNSRHGMRLAMGHALLLMAPALALALLR